MRSLRRASLPLAMSKGYNPRPRISLPAPLSLGYIGRNEVLDLELSQWCKPEYVRTKVNQFLPEGIRMISVQLLGEKPGREPDGFSYSIPLKGDTPVCKEKIMQIEGKELLEIERRNDKGVKKKNIAPFIKHLRSSNGCLLMLLKTTHQGTAKPEEVLKLLGCRPYTHYFPSQITRTHVSLVSSIK